MRYTIILILLILSGCLTEQRAVKQMVSIHYKYPLIEAKNCASLFPPSFDTPAPVVIHHSDTTYLPGDTLWVECPDTMHKENDGSKLRYPIRIPVTCPPQLIIHTRDSITQTVTVTNTAAVAASNMERDKYKQQATNNRTWALIASAIACLEALLLWLSLRERKKD